jgi:tetratricopeptide (TPR) repeat protein
MTMKPKTLRRLILLGALVTVLGGGFAGAVIVRNHRMSARLAEHRELGFKAAAAGDNFVALDRLGAYLRRRPEDAEALLAYARARRAIEERAGRHLVEAAGVYQRYLSLKPADDAARDELLDILSGTSLDVEIIDLASRMRPSDLAQLTERHARVVREEVAARLRRKDVGPPTIELARRLIEIAPGEYTSRALYVAALLAAERRQDAVDFVDAAAKADPDDPRVTLLQAAIGDPRVGEKGWLLGRLAAIAGLDPATAKRVGPPVDASPNILAAVVSGFDSLGRPDLSLAALTPAADAGNPEAVREWVRRCWYSAKDADLLAPKAPPAKGPDPWADPDVLALRALSLLRTGDTPGAQAGFKRLTGPDFRSRAWAAAAPGLGLAASTPDQTASALRAAVEINPLEPVFRVSLAESLLHQAQPEVARQELTQAIESPYSPGWPAPYILLADSYLAEGRPTEAEKAAVQGLARHPRDPRLNLMGLVSKIDQVDRGLAERDATEALLKRLDAIAQDWAGAPDSAPGEQSLQWFILGRAVCADALGDSARLAAALNDAAPVAAKLSPPVRARLAIISARNKLDGSTGTALAPASGPSTPESVLAQIVMLRDSGHADDARALVDQTLADPAHTTPEWQQLRPRALEAIADPRAAAAWKQSADANEFDLPAQLAALEAQSVAHDPALVDQIVGRFAKSAGPSGKLPLRVRLAQARSLLLQPPSVTSRDRAIGILRPVTSEAPELAEPRLMLADALLMEAPGGPAPDRAGAIEQLRAAIPLSSRPWEPRARIAELLSASGDNQAASRDFAAIASDARADVAVRWAAVGRLAALGQFETAAPIANSLADLPGPLTPSHAVTAARIHASIGNPARAAQVLDRLAGTGLSADEASDVASAWAAIGDMDKAKAVIERAAAGAPDRTPFDRALIRLQAQSSPDEAVTAAVKLRDQGPQNPENHRALIALYLTQNRLDEAGVAAEHALKLHPDDPDLRLQQVQVSLARGAADVPSLEALAKALEAKPELKRRAQAVRALVTLTTSDKAGDPGALKALAGEFADEPAVASYVSEELLRRGLAPDAADVATGALRRFPTSAQLARDAYNAAAAARRWQDAAIAAEQWRQVGHVREADIAIARANLALGRPRPAKAALERHVYAATHDPDHSIPVLGLWTEVLLASQPGDDARNFLEPIAAGSPQVLRSVWIPLASARVPVKEAPRWLERAEALVGNDAADKLLVANAWFAFADRDPPHRADALARARTIATAVSASGSSPQALYLLAMIGGAEGNYDRAEADFTAAAASDSMKVPAKIGLARIALSRSRPQDAVRLAKEAVSASNPPDSDARLVLAEALQSVADAEREPQRQRTGWIEAAEAFEAAAQGRADAPVVLAQAALCRSQAHQNNDAIRLYEAALQSSALDPATRAGVQNNLAYLLVTARTDPASTARGLELARLSADAQPSGPTFDTLGACELAAGNTQAAITALRHSLNLRANEPETMVKLAEALLASSPPDASEAGPLLDQADKLLAAKPDASVSERLALARAKLKSASPR